MSFLAWKRHPRLWIPAALFLLLNLGLLGAYRLYLADDAELGRGLLERRKSLLEETVALRDGLEMVLSDAGEAEAGLAEFYTDRLATEQRMLTAVIAEVKDLASRAGLAPDAILYDRETIERQGLIQRSFDFRVLGTYSQLRQLINFLELSATFLMLDDVSLGGGGQEGEPLGIDLRISTLFAEELPQDATREAAR